jgi:hypothetical protein
MWRRKRGIAPEIYEGVPSQNISPDALFKSNPRPIVIFIAEVRFQDGTTYHADTTKINNRRRKLQVI